MTATSLKPPAHSEELKVEFPAEHVLLLTLNRPKSLNAMTPRMGEDLRNVLDWFETEPHLWVVIVTGAGRIFCAGADLKAWNNDQQQNKTDEQERVAADVHGFGSLSRRQSLKPIIAAVPGGAYGGGMEILLNCDIVVAAEGAKFALPEVKRGVVAIQGGIPRLARISGHQLASELLLLGRTIDAAEAQNRFGFVNQVVPPSKVLSAALDIAKQIVANSPDAVQSTKEGLLISQKLGFHETLLADVGSPASTRVYKGDNIKEGLKAFNEKRSPAWRNPAKL
ncbi:putative enoyl-CoA hydratase isomerase family protein [Lyophyllum shimeji]|uniref:Enoyl-CoA hydratase isomerase family protein n=1 Tax=Lyophyllum shimeji TaxID=47721 RepID=A0A9P3Q1J9_LYOSH|nr:putative enoyl-CoA hydratase isomerase family protein [Lyophyllum shimeji]